MSTRESKSSLPDGTILDGRYRLTRRIGRGGFATIYEGEHIDLGRNAAVKVLDLPTTKTHAEFTERFLREARIVARLSHPNIVSVYDFGIHAETGQPYIAMELLRGYDLEQELSLNGPLEPGRAKTLFVEAATALGVAHAEGVVHKDLKPSNLFIANPSSAIERMVLLDFGIAWAGDDTGRLTQDGSFTGTPAYVAPEYARRLEVSPAVDVYQIGLILSEALSCTPCVSGHSSVQLIISHCQGELVVPDQVQASEFGALIKRATAMDPSMRFSDGQTMADALAQVDPTTMIRMAFTVAPSGARTAEHLMTLSDRPAVTVVEPADLSIRSELAPTIADVSPASEALSWPWLAVALAGLLVVAGVVAARVAPDTTPEPEPATPEPVVAIAAAPVETVDEPEFVVPDLGEPLPTTKFTVATIPMGAAVYLGEELLGRSPVVLRGDRVDGSEVALRIELDGYRSADVITPLVDGARVDLELESTAPPAPPPDESGTTQLMELLKLSQQYQNQETPNQ